MAYTDKNKLRVVYGDYVLGGGTICRKEKED